MNSHLTLKIVLVISLSGSIGLAQSTAQPATPTPQAVSSSNSATQLIQAAGINQIILGAMKSGSRLFTQAAKETTNLETRKKIEKAQQLFSNSQLEKELHKEVQDKLARQFSEAELKYLVQLLSSPTAKKFRSFMSSQEIQFVHSKSFERAKTLLAQATQTPTKATSK